MRDEREPYEDDLGPQPRLRPVLWSALDSLPRGAPLIKGLIDRGTMSVLYGASGSYKTGVGVDIGGHVALARVWRGLKVNGGKVLYIAAEAGYSIERRLTAFRIHHGIEPCDELAVLPVTVDLCHDDNDTSEVIAGARWIFGAPPVLIIVDTLSRALAGGNENAPDGMGGFVRNCDRLRQETGAHVLAIHHTGKDDARGARGHSLLRAAVDTEIEVTKDNISGQVTVTVTKQRDYVTGGAFVFRPEQIDLGMDEDEEPVTSYVLIPVEQETASAKRRAVNIAPATRVALDLLRKAIAEAGEIPPASNHIPSATRCTTADMWRRYCYAGQVAESDKPDAKRQAFNRSLRQLQSAALIGVWDPWVWAT
jgi:hypothetical protein